MIRRALLAPAVDHLTLRTIVDGRIQRHESEDVAEIEGKLYHLLAADLSRHICVVGVKDRSLRGYSDLLLGAAHFKYDVLRGILSDFERKALLVVGLEPAGFHCQIIIGWRYQAEREVARSVRRIDAGNPLFRAGQSNLCIGDTRARLVCDRS